MNNDIKEILENVQKCCEIMKDQNFVVYQKQDILKVLDYITNLQEENEQLKELTKDKLYCDNCEFKKDYDRYADIIDQAIEYCERCLRALKDAEENITEAIDINTLLMIINILKGGDHNGL